MTTPVFNQHPKHYFDSQRIDGKICYFANDDSVFIKITEEEFKAEAFELNIISKSGAYSPDCASCFLNHAHSKGYHNQNIARANSIERNTAKPLGEVTPEELSTRCVYLSTGFGTFLVTAITKDFWVVCPKANGGFGRSFCCHEGTQVLINDE